MSGPRFENPSFNVSSAGTSQDFDKGHVQTFGTRCGMHPLYGGAEKPSNHCLRCWRLWESLHPGEEAVW